MAVVHPATFVKKSAYDRYGTFDLKYKCQMDRDLLLRMYVAGAKFQYLNEDLAMMRLGGVNQRTYVKQTVPEGIRNFDKKWDELKNKKEGIFAGYASNNKVIRQLIDLALLQNNMLKGEALNNFVKRSIELI